MLMHKFIPGDTLRSLLSDALIVSISNGILKASNAVIFILIVRTLGKTVAGQFSITTSYVAIALGLALLGLDEILIREAHQQEDTTILFMNFLAARIGLILLSILLLALFLVISRLYEPSLNALILLFACGQIGDGVLLLCQALFIAQDRTNLVLLISASISFVRILAALAIVALGGGLAHLFLLYVVTSYGGAGVALWLAKDRIFRASRDQLLGFVNRSYITQRIKQSFSFFWINLFVLLEFQMDIVLLSILGSVSDVALYSSALTIFTALWIAPQAYRTSLYVRLAKAYQHTRSGFWRFLRRSTLGSLGLGAAAGMLLAASAPLLFQLLYPTGYNSGIVVLRVLSIQLLIAFANAPGTRGLLTLHKERLAAILTALAMVLNLAANLFLIPRYGPLGAAWAKVTSAAAFYVLTYMTLILVRLRSGNVWSVSFDNGGLK